MRVPDPYRAGLDPAHITAICSRATGRNVLAVGTSGGIAVCLPTRRTARTACVALARVGYAATIHAGGHSRDLVVTGWSPAGLEARLAALRAVLHQLAENPSMTARAVVERYRHLPAGASLPDAGSQILDHARAGLRDRVEARSGIHTRRNPAVVPADIGVNLRLHVARVLEESIDDLVQRHLRVAEQALVLFASLREEMDTGRAAEAATRWAGIFFRLPSSPAQDSAPLLRGAAPPVSRVPVGNVITVPVARSAQRGRARDRDSRLLRHQGQDGVSHGH